MKVFLTIDYCTYINQLLVLGRPFNCVDWIPIVDCFGHNSQLLYQSFLKLVSSQNAIVDHCMYPTIVDYYAMQLKSKIE